jgi:hypothetical protein
VVWGHIYTVPYTFWLKLSIIFAFAAVTASALCDLSSLSVVVMPLVLQIITVDSGEELDGCDRGRDLPWVAVF